MATTYLELTPEGAVFPASSFPQYVKNAGTNFPVSGLAYADTGTEGAVWSFTARGYGSGNVTCEVLWYADTASSGDVVWEAQLAAITANTDSQDVETDALTTANTVTDSHLGTTGQRLHSASITVSNLDSLAAGDEVWFKLTRNGTAGADTMSGDAVVTLVTLSYSDT